jgi:hypothetical protein
MTDQSQPLDIGVFGSLRATGRQVFRDRAASGPNEELTMQMFIWTWEQLSTGVIEGVWKSHTGCDDDE